jgi:ribonucleotide monophosphatase NagD (HAD superfamily)
MNLIKNFNIDFVFIFVKPQFGLLFDIDGVLTRGRKLLPYTRDAFRKLVTTSGQFRIPTVFVTNAGNELRSSKAAKLSQILGIPVNSFISY